MLRNELTTLLGEKNNDNVAVRIGGAPVDVDGVALSGENIALRLDPDGLAAALRTMAPPDEAVRP